MCLSCIKEEHGEIIRVVIFSVFFGIVLPTFDAGGDIRLAIRLYENGHPKWSLSVLTPVLINTLFTIVISRKIEEERKSRFWVIYLPLVLLQIYPQYCLLRLLLDFGRGKMKLEELT